MINRLGMSPDDLQAFEEQLINEAEQEAHYVKQRSASKS